jgi:hypothetical protein
MKTKIIVGLVAIIVVGFLTGCATNPYSAYYHSNHKTESFLPAGSDVTVEQIHDAQFHAKIADMKAQGWVCVGCSDFNYRAGLPPQELVIEQARRVGSDKVVLVSKIVGVQTVMALPTIQPSRTYTTTETGGFYSGANYGSYSGTATTTTPMQVGVQYVPCNIPVYEVGASFWRRPQ